MPVDEWEWAPVKEKEGRYFVKLDKL